MSDTPITPAAGILALTGLALSLGSVITPSVGSAAMTGIAPKWGMVISPPGAALNLTPNAPVQGLVLVVPAGALLLQGYQMASGVLYLTEYQSINQDMSSGSLYPKCPSLVDQAVPFGSNSALSTPFSPNTRIIRIQTDSICCVKVGGVAPVAVAGAAGGLTRMTAGQTEYFAVNPGDRVAVISSK